jgi:PAS domain-containing protein
MIVNELLAELEHLDGEAEVRLAFQPEWPLEYNAGIVIEVGPGAEFEGVYPVKDDDGWYLSADGGESYLEMGPYPTSEEAAAALQMRSDLAEGAGENVVYIGEAGQIGYLDPAARRLLGWVRD